MKRLLWIFVSAVFGLLLGVFLGIASAEDVLCRIAGDMEYNAYKARLAGYTLEQAKQETALMFSMTSESDKWRVKIIYDVINDAYTIDRFPMNTPEKRMLEILTSRGYRICKNIVDKRNVP